MIYKTQLFKFIFLALILLFSNSVFGAVLTSSGFSSSSLLISNTTPNSGETIKVSAPVYNQSTGVIYGNVRFYVDGQKINEKPITIKQNEFSGVNFDFKVTKGSHNLQVKLEDTFIQEPKSSKVVTILKNRELSSIINVQGVKDETPFTEDGILKEYTLVNETQKVEQNTTIDSYRQDFLSSSQIKIENIRKDIKQNIETNKQYEARLNELRETVPRSDGTLLTPLQYVYAWILSAVSYILGNVYLFYSLIGLIIFIIIRFIFKRFHHHSLK